MLFQFNFAQEYDSYHSTYYLILAYFKHFTNGANLSMDLPSEVVDSPYWQFEGHWGIMEYKRQLQKQDVEKDEGGWY